MGTVGGAKPGAGGTTVVTFSLFRFFFSSNFAITAFLSRAFAVVEGGTGIWAGARYSTSSGLLSPIDRSSGEDRTDTGGGTGGGRGMEPGPGPGTGPGLGTAPGAGRGSRGGPPFPPGGPVRPPGSSEPSPPPRLAPIFSQGDSAPAMAAARDRGDPRSSIPRPVPVPSTSSSTVHGFGSWSGTPPSCWAASHGASG